MKEILLIAITILLTIAVNYLYRIEKIMEFTNAYDRMQYFEKMPDPKLK